MADYESGSQEKTAAENYPHNTTTKRSQSLHLEVGSRQALRDALESDPKAFLMAGTLKLPLAKGANTHIRRLSYETDTGGQVSMDLPRSDTMREIIFGSGDNVRGEVIELDPSGNETNPIQFEFTHAEEGETPIESNVRGVGLYNIREIDRVDDLNRIIGTMQPAGATGQEVEDPENNPLGGDGTVEGTKVGPRPSVPPNPNIFTGVGTTIGSPPGTGTAM